MSYDIFFVRRDPGQTFEDALDGVEDSYEGGDPGPLTEQDLEFWDAVQPLARQILGDQLEITQDGAETRELTDPATGIGLTLLEGEFEIHVPEDRPDGADSVALMSKVYDLARAVEDVTGLEGYDPQLEEPVSDTSDSSPTRRQWDDDDDEDDDAPSSGAAPVHSPDREPFDPQPAGAVRGRWWEFWKQ
jgi:hypothetical protein